MPITEPISDIKIRTFLEPCGRKRLGIQGEWPHRPLAKWATGHSRLSMHMHFETEFQELLRTLSSCLPEDQEMLGEADQR